MSVSREEVDHIAHLAHLGLLPEEVESFSRDLSSVLDHIRKLQALDTEAVEPTSHVVPLANVMREDEIRPSWSPALVLANAPRRREDFFEVQAVLD